MSVSFLPFFAAGFQACIVVVVVVWEPGAGSQQRGCKIVESVVLCEGGLELVVQDVLFIVCVFCLGGRLAWEGVVWWNKKYR